MLKDLGEHGWGFHCPGCGCGHAFPKDGRWRFDGNLAAPTFSPSLVINRASGGPPTCHLFLKAGLLVFLSDCAHHLAGQTVPMESL